MQAKVGMVLLLLISGNFLFAQSDRDLVALYGARMQAEKAGDTAEMLSVDQALASYYLSIPDYDKARYFLESAVSVSHEPLLTDLKLDIYRLDIIKSDFSKAESGLINVYFYPETDEQKARAAYLLGILKSLEGEYPEARDYLTRSLELRGEWTPEFEQALDSLMADSKKRKNIEKAKWLSTFLPGAGQIYAKNAKGAVGAIGIAAFWGGWFVYDLIQQDYYSAALVLLWPWQRYHRGNIQNAEYSVEDYNARIEDGINRALLEYLSTK